MRNRSQPWFGPAYEDLSPEVQTLVETTLTRADIFVPAVEVLAKIHLARQHGTTLEVTWLEFPSFGDARVVTEYGLAAFFGRNETVVFTSAQTGTHSMSVELILGIHLEAPVIDESGLDCSGWVHAWIQPSPMWPDMLRPRQCRLGDDCKVFAKWAVEQAVVEDPEVCEDCLPEEHCDRRRHDAVVLK